MIKGVVKLLRAQEGNTYAGTLISSTAACPSKKRKEAFVKDINKRVRFCPLQSGFRVKFSHQGQIMILMI